MMTSEGCIGTMLQDFSIFSQKKMKWTLKTAGFNKTMPQHTLREFQQISTFPGRLVSRNGDISRSSRLPDLAQCNSSLWRYLKPEDYVNKPRTLPDSQDTIRNEIVSVPVEMFEKAMRNFGERLHEGMTVHGCHLLDILFHT